MAKTIHLSGEQAINLITELREARKKLIAQNEALMLRAVSAELERDKLKEIVGDVVLGWRDREWADAFDPQTAEMIEVQLRAALKVSK